ncbi:MAG: O-methyltransferase [Gemmatimonadota bacterium]
MIDLSAFLEARGAAVDAEREEMFRRLASLTALRIASDGSFYISNYYRAHLLSTLVAIHRPATILEIGTGRGYGALAMAMAAEYTGTDARILSVDVLPPDHVQMWPIDEGAGPCIVERKLIDVWSSLPGEWTGRITLITGRSTDVMKEMLADPGAPPIDLAFIDGGHDYWTARHDVLAAVLSARNRPLTIVMDDYGGVQGGDVIKLVEKVMRPRIAADAMSIIRMPQSATEHADNGPHAMVYIDGRRTTLGPSVVAPTSFAGYGVYRAAAGAEGIAIAMKRRATRLLHGRGARR